MRLQHWELVFHSLGKHSIVTLRRALYPSRNLEAGHVIVPEDLLCLRPCVGIGAEHYDQVVGLKLLRPVQKLQKLDLSFFSDSVK
jgi:sialic acid synthase SpsE